MIITNKIFKSILTLTLFLSWISVSAQNTIKGKLLDENGEGLPYVSVALKADNTYKYGTVTADDGKFTINDIKNGEYTAEISFIGYAKITKSLTLAGGTTDFGTIKMTPITSAISEVTITAEAPRESVSIEKTSINTSSSMASATGSILDVLATSSAVSIDGKGGVSIRGNSNTLILIDGLPTSIDALGAIPASISKKIEIITSPDASYDAEGTGGIINIITERKGSSGFNGMVQANYGTVKHGNAVVSLGYNKQRLNLNFNLNGNYDIEDEKSSLDRLFHGTGTSIHQDIDSRHKTRAISAALSASFKLSDKDNLTAGVKAMFPGINNTQELLIRNLSGNIKRQNMINFNRKVFEANVGYQRTFVPKVNSLSLAVSFSQTKGSRPADYYQEGEHVQRSAGGGRPRIINVSGDYKHNFSNGIGLTTGLKYTNRNNNFKYDSWVKEAGQWKHSDFFSSDLRHNENIFAAYVNASGKFSKVTTKIGGRIEYSTTDMHSVLTSDTTSSCLFFSPYLYAAVPVGNGKFELTATRRITRPTYPQLNPFINMVDAVTYETGNRNLRPEKTTKVDLGYALNVSKFNLQTTLFFEHNKDYITQISSLYGDDALIITYDNGTMMRAGIDLFAKYNIAGWFTASLSANAYYGDAKYEYEGKIEKNSGPVVSGNIALLFHPIKSLDIELRYFANSKQYYPQFTADATHYCNLSVKYNILNNLSASLILTDLFNTRAWNIHANNTIYKLDNFSKTQSRVLWIGVSYTFGSFKKAESKKTEDNNRSIIRLGSE